MGSKEGLSLSPARPAHDESGRAQSHPGTPRVLSVRHKCGKALSLPLRQASARRCAERVLQIVQVDFNDLAADAGIEQPEAVEDRGLGFCAFHEREGY